MKEDSVRSVERAFSILKAFTRDDYKLTLSELAERIQLPVTTTLRLANTLENLNMLHRHSDRCYSLGNQLYLLGSVAKANFRPQQIIYPYMKQIRDETKEAVSLYGVIGEDRACFEHGLVPGRDISVFAFGDQEKAMLMTPALATVMNVGVEETIRDIIAEYCPGATRSEVLTFRLKHTEIHEGESIIQTFAGGK